MLRTISLLVLIGCTNPAPDSKRSAYDCEKNPKDCNGGVDEENPTDETGNESSFKITPPKSAVAGTSSIISWEPLEGVQSYDLTIANDKECNNPVITLEKQTARQQSVIIANSGTYYICVHGNKPDGSKVASASNGVSFTVTGNNAPPTFSTAVGANISGLTGTGEQSSAFSFNLDEDTSNGEFSFQVSDPDGDTVTVSSDDKPTWVSIVNVDSTNKKLTFNPTASGIGTKSFSVKLSDPAGATKQIYFSATVNEQNDAVSDVALSSQTIDEGLGANAVVGTLSAVDEDSGDSHTFTLVAGTGSTDNASFNISGSSLRATSNLDYDTKNSYSVRIRGADGSTNAERAFTISVNNVSQTPTDISLSATAINENVAGGSTVGSLSTTDPDSGDSFTYSLVAGTGSTDNASFTISGANLNINSSPNHEAKDSYSVRVRTTDSTSNTFEKAFTITITDLNEAPTDIALDSTTVAENAGSNATVGNLSSTDPDSGESWTYTLVAGSGDGDNGLFNISGSTLRLTSSANFEGDPTLNVRIQSQDQGGTGLTYSEAFVISVTNVNEAPTAISLTSQAVDENAGANAVVGTLSTTDPDSGDSWVYSFVAGTGDADNGDFNISGTSLRLTASANHEATATKTVRIQTQDTGGTGLTYANNYTITINDLNEAPTDISLSSTSVDENLAINTVVGTLSTTEPDSGQLHTYALVAGTGSTDNASFNISGTSLRTSAVFDYETKNSYAIRLRTTDNGTGTLTHEKQFTISINDTAENLTITYTTAGNYTYDNTLLTVTGGVATLLALNQTYNDNTSTEFGLSNARNNVNWDTDHIEIDNSGAPDPRPLPNDFYYGVDASNLDFLIHLDDPWVDNGDTLFSDVGPNGTLSTSGTSNKSVRGKHGRALNFNGTNQYVNFGDSSNLELTMPFTINAWIKLDTLASSDESYAIVSKYYSGLTAREWILNLDGITDKLAFSKSSDGAGGASVEKVESDYVFTGSDLGKWKHVSISVDGSGNWNFYIDGSSSGSGTFSSTTIHTSSSSGYIGAVVQSSSIPDLFFDGSIDELSIFSRALSGTEISTLHQNQVKNFTHEHWTEAPGLMDGNVLLFHMDEASGNLIDYSGLANNTTVTFGTPTYAQTGKVGSAISLDGSEYFSIPNDPLGTNYTNYTVSAWIKTTDTGAQFFLRTPNDNNYASACSVNASGYANMDDWFPSGGNLLSTSTVNDDNWHHIVCARSGSNRYLYVDGVLEASQTSAETYSSSAPTKICIGARCSGGFGYDGLIDELAVWNRGLSAQEVQTIYNLQSGNTRSNIHEFSNDQSQTVDDWFPMNSNVLLMHFNETTVKDSGTNPTLYDYSGNGNNGTYEATNDGNEKSTSGKLGKAISFDGTGDYIDVSSNDIVTNNDDWSIAIWFNLSSYTNGTAVNGSGTYIFDRTTATNGITSLKAVGDNYCFQKRYDSASGLGCATGSKIKTGSWQHAVLVRDVTNSLFRIYINGNQEGTTSDTGAALTMPDLRLGRHQSGSYMTGSIDEFAIWDRALSADEIKKIYDYQSATYTGTFTSQIFDSGSTTASWTTLGWDMIRPYGKELGASSDLSTSYTALPNDTLMNNNIFLLKFNETAADTLASNYDVEDFSGNDNHGEDVGSPTYAALGRFGYGLDLDGSSDYVDFSALNITTNTLTIAGWVYSRGRTTTYSPILAFSRDATQSWGVHYRNATNEIAYVWNDNSSATYDWSSGLTLNDNEWSFVAVVINASSGATAYLGNSGGLNSALNNITHNNQTLDSTLRVGYDSQSSLRKFNGIVDDFAIWDRALSLSEIQELYRRGASRIRFQVRSCDASGCDDEAWVTPDSTMTPYSSYGEFFSELQNTTTSNPSLTFGGFGSHSVSNNQFFQWKAFLDTYDTSEIPELKSVTVGPTHYYGGVATIVNDNALSFSTLTSFAETAGGSNVGTFKYQLSNDGGTTWYYYTGSAWSATTDNANTNPASTINTNVGTFPTGSGSLKVKAFLESANAAQVVELDELTIGYTP